MPTAHRNQLFHGMHEGLGGSGRSGDGECTGEQTERGRAGRGGMEGGVEHFQGPEEASTYGAESSFLPPF